MIDRKRLEELRKQTLFGLEHINEMLDTISKLLAVKEAAEGIYPKIDVKTGRLIEMCGMDRLQETIKTFEEVERG